MRGLKPFISLSPVALALSHLLQMRGLKLSASTRNSGGTVASFTDAWIETETWSRTANLDSVASFTDAWIETKRGTTTREIGNCRIFYRCVDWNSIQVYCMLSRQRRIFYRCVDWNTVPWTHNQCQRVASFTDAWIETWSKRIYRIIHKCRIFYRCVDWNFKFRYLFWQIFVASFTDAWIETSTSSDVSVRYLVASFTDAWIETSCKITLLWSVLVSHLLQMRGLKPKIVNRNTGGNGRIFYRCVDWNRIGRRIKRYQLVASFTDAWIETSLL